jgi:hypothetical protein
VSSSLTFESTRLKALRENVTQWDMAEQKKRKNRFPTKAKLRRKMDGIADFLFETMQLKRIQRTGYQFLGREKNPLPNIPVVSCSWPGPWLGLCPM